FDIFEAIVDSCARGCQVGALILKQKTGLRLAIWLGAHVHADVAESASLVYWLAISTAKSASFKCSFMHFAVRLSIFLLGLLGRLDSKLWTPNFEVLHALWRKILILKPFDATIGHC